MSTNDREATISAQKERIIQLHGMLDDAWWAAWCAIWPVVGHGRETSRDWCEDVDKLGRLERELAAVTAERDALKEKKWAGPRVRASFDQWQRNDVYGMQVILSHDSNVEQREAALVAAGWYLAPQLPGTPDK